MNILVTGGAGFIGSNYIRMMFKQYPDIEITNLDKLTYAGNLDNLRDITNPGYTFIKSDICDPDVVNKAMEGVDTVVHFAAESHVDRSIKDGSVFVTTNVLGTNTLLNCALQSDVNRFIHVSTDEVYGSIKEGSFTEKETVIKTITELKPDIVINVAAYTDVDGCEDNVDHALRVNGEALTHIARACFEKGAKLIHYSTDYVFDGTKQEYRESDATNPINVYGRSKLLGEQNIMEHMEDYRIIRTSWLFGRHGKNFVETMLDLAGQMEQVKVVNDQFGKPTYTADLAQKTADIIDMEPGIYHITNEGVCSWYEFASAIIPNAVPCTSNEFVRKAARPKYSVLVNTKTGLMRHWRDALRDYLKGFDGTT